MDRRIGFIAFLVLGEMTAILLCGSTFLQLLHHSNFVLPSDLNCFRWNAGQLSLHPVASTGPKGPWMYPPPFLLLTAPLTWLAPAPCFLLWGLAGMILMGIAGRLTGMSWPALILGLLSPVSIDCLLIGQASEITSALLLISLALVERNPGLAGIFAGALIVKPQFAILLPVCFLAARNFRSFLSAAITALVLCLLSLALFGLHPWLLFFTQERQTAAAVINHPWPQNYECIMVSSFMLMRSLGAGLHLAYAVQGCSTLAAMAAAWWLWRSPREPALRLVLTLCLLPLASPYVYVYDLSGLAMAMLFFCASRHWRYLGPLAVLWVVTSAYTLFTLVAGCTIGAPMILILILAIFAQEAASEPMSAAMLPAA